MLRRHLKSDQAAQIFDQPRTVVKNSLTGQIFIEYTIVIGVIVLVIFAMGTTIKRGTQAMIKTVADEVGNQAGADQQFDDTGHLESSHTATHTRASRTIDEFLGNTMYGYDEVTTSAVDISINLGFTETK